MLVLIGVLNYTISNLSGYAFRMSMNQDVHRIRKSLAVA